MLAFLIEAQGLLALAFFGLLVVFLLYEAMQVVRGRVHLRGIGRAALELLIVAPVIILVIFACQRIAERFGFNGLETNAFTRWITCLVLFVVWAPWSHYRAQKHTRRLESQVSHPKKTEVAT